MLLPASAHAAVSSPISLNVGGYDDFVAGIDNGVVPSGANAKKDDFENEFKLNFDALGKGSNGIEYGANVSLWNGPEVTNSGKAAAAGVAINSAYVWLSGAFGKVLFGDEHGASDLFVYAPTVGEGQADGRYMDFLSVAKVARIMPSGFDNTEHSTKITYYTPKVGNDMNKVQLGVSYAPSLYDYGSGIAKDYNSTAASTVPGGTPNSAYQDLIKAAVQYTGNFKPVSVVGSAQFIHGGNTSTPLSNTLTGGFGEQTALGGGVAGFPAAAAPAGLAKSFNAWGVGGQATWMGITAGASYTNLGRYNTVAAQNKNQNVVSAGAKYEFDKVGVAVNYVGAEGYDNMLLGGSTAVGAANTNYVHDFNGYGAGATYTWFPGLTSNVDGMLFKQSDADQLGTTGGYVLLVSQKLTF